MGRLLSYLVDLIFLIVVSKILGRALRSLFTASDPRRRNNAGAGQPGNPSGVHAGKTERDPVCGMFVSTELSCRLVVGSETLHFCSRECLERYQKEFAHVSS
jgi:YHS domain-containing protein